MIFMPGSSGLRAVTLIGKTEVRRSWRALSPDGRLATVKILGAIGLLGFYAISLAVTAYFGVSAVREGASVRVVARSAVIGLLGLTVFITTPRTVRTNGYPDAGSGLLTATTHRRVAFGLALGEFTRIMGVVSIPILGLAVGVGAGSMSILAGLVVVGVLTVTIAAGTAIGFALGLLIKRIATTSELARRHRTAAALAVSISLPLGYAVLAAHQGLTREIATAVSSIPLAWGADAVLLFVPGTSTSPLPAAVGLGTLVVVPAVLGPAVERLAGTAWFTDRPPVERAEAGRLQGWTLQQWPFSYIPPETRVVALKSIRRAIRAPFTVQYATLGLFALLAEVQQIVITGQVHPRVPVFVALAGAWAAGSLFALNPIGNEGTVRPVTVTSGVGGRPFLAGLSLASIVIAVPPTLVVVVAAGLAVPIEVTRLIALGLMTPVLCAGATGLASLTGTRYPNCSATTVGRDRSLIVPSPWALAAFSGLFLIAAGPAMLGSVTPIANALSSPLGIAPRQLWWLGVLCTTLFTGVGGVVAGRRAADRIDRWHLEMEPD